MLIAGTLEAQTRTTNDGIYSAEQAKRGEAVYADKCAGCHRPDLSGGAFAPPLAGPLFQRVWTGKRLDELYLITKVRMPGYTPGSLTNEEYGDSIAFLLQRNQFVAGEQPLQPDEAQLSGILFVPPANLAR